MIIYFDTKEETIKKLIMKSKSLIKKVSIELELLSEQLDNFMLTREVSDLYYAVFYLAEVLLLIKGETKIKRHSTVNYLISKYYRELSPSFSNLFRLRNEADYSLNFEISEEEIRELLKEAKKFYEKTLEYLKKENVLSEEEIRELKF